MPLPPPVPTDARRGDPGRLAWIAIAAVLAVFFAPAILDAGDFVYRDTGRMHAPMKSWIASELRGGRFPQWNPHAGLGAPVVANAIDAVQHPFTLLLTVMPPRAALKAWVLLSFALAAAGAYVWTRALERTRAAAALAALAFSLSGPLVSSSDNLTYLTAYAAIPWVLAAAHRAIARGGPAPLLAVGIASAVCAAAGDPQGWGIAVALLVPYAWLVAPPGGVRAAIRRGVAAVLAATVAAAPFVLPVALWLPETRRAAIGAAPELTRWNLHPSRLLELLVPELFRGGDPADPVASVFAAYAGNDLTAIPWFLSVYLGAAVVALAALGAARERRARGFAVAAAAFAWAALGSYAGFAQLAARLPILGGFRYWEKMTVWVALLAAAAAAHGADALVARPGRAFARATAVLAAVLLALALVAWSSPGLVHAVAGADGASALALATNLASGGVRAGVTAALLALVAAAAARGRLRAGAPLVLAGVVALDLFGGNAGAYVLGPPQPQGRPALAAGLPAGARVITPFPMREDRWPQLGRLGSTWEWGRRTLEASWNVPLRVGSFRDYVGLRQNRWARYRDRIDENDRFVRLGLFGFSQMVVPESPDLAARAGVTGTPRVVASDPEVPAFLVDVPHRPRSYLAGALERAGDAEALAFASSGGPDGSSVLEGPLPAGYTVPEGRTRIARDEPGDTVIEALADRRALVVLNDAFAPGWRATVDGREAPILRANGLVRGVWIDAGAHEVRFRYRTPGLVAGWAIALLGALAVAAWAWAMRGRRAARSD